MRLVAGILLLASAATADDEVTSVKRVTAALYFSGHGGAINGVSEGGMGPAVELAGGFGRTQVFLEGGIAWTTLGAVEPFETGFMVRGGVGARWIARSFELDHEGAVEMTFNGLVGVQRIWWDESEQPPDDLTRPEFGLGVGLQMRKFKNPHVSIRFEMRVFFAPSDRETTTAARCAGECASDAPLTNGGLMFNVGAAL